MGLTTIQKSKNKIMFLTCLVRVMEKVNKTHEVLAMENLHIRERLHDEIIGKQIAEIRNDNGKSLIRICKEHGS